jgi:hypothetical protein
MTKLECLATGMDLAEMVNVFVMKATPEKIVAY